MKDFVFKLKTAWNAYKTAGDILAAEKAFEDECRYELEQRAYMDRMDSWGEWSDKCASDAIKKGLSELPAKIEKYRESLASECSTLHPPHQDAVISEPRVVQRKPRVTMAKRRKNAKKRTAK